MKSLRCVHMYRLLVMIPDLHLCHFGSERLRVGNLFLPGTRNVLLAELTSGILSACR